MQTKGFGWTKEGQEAVLYILENRKGVKAAVTNYGANLVWLVAPDKNGETEDVVLGFDSVSGYEENPSFFGALIGPSANRICKASFTLNGKTYTLKKNNGENNLHSDEERATHKRIWNAQVQGESLTLTLSMADMDMGFPGNKEFKVTYSLTEDNELIIRYEITSDQDTIINPTNHSYFNLKGHGKGDILDHKITLRASYYTPTDAASIPTGEILPVEGTPMDLRQETVIGEKIDSDFEQLCLAGGYDHNWVTDNYDGRVRLIAVIKGPDDLRTMEVYTDLPGVQFYAGNFIDDQTGKDGVTYGKRNGLCLETQFYPDSIHNAHFPSSIFGSERKYESTTIYKLL